MYGCNTVGGVSGFIKICPFSVSMYLLQDQIPEDDFYILYILGETGIYGKIFRETFGCTPKE